MSEPVLITIIASVAPVLVALGALWKVTHNISKISNQVLAIHLQLNGRLDQLLKDREKAGFDKGEESMNRKSGSKP